MVNHSLVAQGIKLLPLQSLIFVADVVCWLRLLKVFGAHKVHMRATLPQGRKNNDAYRVVCAVQSFYAYGLGSKGRCVCKTFLQGLGRQKRDKPLGIVGMHQPDLLGPDFF